MTYLSGYTGGYTGTATPSAGVVFLSDAVQVTDIATTDKTAPTLPVGIPGRMRLRLVAYDPGGSLRGDVPFGLSLSRYVQMGEVPTAEAEYSFLQRNVPYLDGPVEVALQYSDVAGEWQEPLNARYLIDKDDYDRRDNGQFVHRYAFQGWVTQLKYADVGATSLNAEGKRVFNSTTPGGIMLTLINQAKTAGFLPFVNVGFTANRTSDGQAWSKVATRDYSPEIDLLSVLQNFFEAGLADFWTDGRTLHMSNPDTVLGRDLSGGLSPVYIRDQTLTSSPESITYGEMITQVRVVGDNGFVMLRNNPTASRAFGERVMTLALGGVSDEGTAITYADQLLETGKAPSRSLSREYTVTDTTKYAPERNYRTGDWIKADTANGLGERMRAFATSVREEGGELKAFVTLGTVHDDLLLRLAKRQNGITGGSGVNSGGTPAPTIPDSAVPKAPQGLVVDADAYNDNAGYAQAVISATWSAVTQSTADGPVDVSGYELWYRENTTGATSRMLRRVQDTTVTYSPLVTGREYAFKVRAYTNTKQGAFSSPEVVVTMPTDAVPPPRPSLPIITSTLGVITVAWDGKSETGGNMPFDFRHVEVFQQQDVDATLIDSLAVKGFTSIGGLTAGQTYNFALRAVDKTGNTSPLTSWVPQTVVSQIYTTQISDAGITAPKIAANAVTADAIMAGSIDGMLITAPIIRTAATGRRSQFDSQGLRLWNASNQLKVWANPSTGQLRIYSTGDASHTSTAHGLQFGDDTGENLIIDSNEIMSRNNGNYNQLLLNREGGTVLIGGIKGGLAEDGSRLYPASGDHTISLRGHVIVSNTSDGGYADEYPPLAIGTVAGYHMWMDYNEIGAANGDAPARLFINPPREAPNSAGNTHHTELATIGSNSLAIQRYGDYNAGTRSTFLFGYDGDCDLGIRFSGNQDRIYITSRDAQTAKVISAADHVITSSRASKRDIGAVTEALAKVRAAKAHRWKYRPEVETSDRWHVGPMHEDLPPEVLAGDGDPNGVTEIERQGSVSLSGMLGLLWAAVDELSAQVDALKPKGGNGKP